MHQKNFQKLQRMVKGQQNYVVVKREKKISQSPRLERFFWFYFTLRCEEIANEYSQIVHGQS